MWTPSKLQPKRTSRLPFSVLLLLVLLLGPAYSFAQTRPALKEAGRVSVSPALTQAARTFLAQDPRLARPAEDYELWAARTSPAGTHLTFQQVYRGVPVYHRTVKVSLNAAGRPTLATGRPLDLTVAPDLTPRHSAAQAQAQALAAAGTGGRSTPPALMIYPGPPLRLVWQVRVWPASRSGEWEVLVDAQTGEVILAQDRSMPRRKAEAPAQAAPVHAATHPAAVHPAARVLGQGLVFDPDPLTTANQTYGGSYADNDNADTDELNNERLLVDLPDLTLGTDGLHYLAGPHVEIVPFRANGLVNYTPPAEADPTAFQYLRSDDRFEAVNLYFHVDQSQRYVQALGFTDLQNTPIAANPFGEGDIDNSRYYPGANMLSFGAGGIDDAEDAFVIWHEYGHALLEAAAADLYGAGPEGAALHEGWADYWAASYIRSLIESGKVPDHDWRRLFRWDGNTAAFQGRVMQTSATYPSGVSTNQYTTGTLWGTTLMEIYDAVGREVCDVLNLQSHFYLTAPTTMPEAAQGLIQADIDLFGGQHTPTLIDILGNRGFVDPATFKPSITHTPPADTEQLGGNRTLEADIIGLVFPITSVQLVYQYGTEAPRTLAFEAAQAPRYTVTLPLPDEPTLVSYYIDVTDTEGQHTRLPEGEARFTFQAGPDAEAPQITHAPLNEVALAGWPVDVLAQVTDNLGVDTVFVSYEVAAGPTDPPRETGSFGLQAGDNSYRGTFPIPATRVQNGDVIRYRIHARDVASTTNTAILPEPEQPPYMLLLTATGVLQTFDFEGTAPGVSGTGMWAQGVPAFGLEVAHSGRQVWGTALDRAYPSTPAEGFLTLPPVNLSGLGQVYLRFWHWYDIEHDGTAQPGSPIEATLWDGGTVQVSTDGGVTWTATPPETGYDGTIAAGFGNPLGGQPAFGGFSFGWRPELIPLPEAADVRVRFAFGTDQSNSEPSESYAGWYIDDVAFTLDRPTDEGPPVILVPPPDLHILDANGMQPPPTVVVQAVDDFGIEQVQLTYTIITAAGETEGGTRMRMRPDDLTLFEAVLPVDPTQVRAGDTISYRLRIVDFAGNETFGGSYRFSYRLQALRDVLTDVRPSGYWQQVDARWRTLPATPDPRRSSLVLAPIDLPDNAEHIELRVQHAYRLGAGAGGNLKISQDAGGSWTLFGPIGGGYTGTLVQAPNEAVFTGTSGAEPAETTYLLSDFGGRQIWLRFDFFNAGPLEAGAFWEIQDVQVVQSTDAPDFETPRTLALYPNFPDPFSTSTTLTYTLPEAMPVSLVLYDLLGRAVRVLDDGTRGAGNHTLTIDGTALSAGVYFLHFQAGREERLEKMVVAK